MEPRWREVWTPDARLKKREWATWAYKIVSLLKPRVVCRILMHSRRARGFTLGPKAYHSFRWGSDESDNVSVNCLV